MQPTDAKLTPLMQQYWDVKAKYDQEIVLFRMGDFYEMFHRDAETAAPILGIALTQRNKKDADSPKMCGVPYHSIAGQIAKLLCAGHKVAMCDQMEDPALAKGLVKRAVTRVLTPGMVYDPDTLDQISANYLAAYDEGALACVDLATGEAFVYEFGDEAEREELIALLSPVELVVTPKQALKRRALNCRRLASEHDATVDGPRAGLERLRAYVEKLQGPSVLNALKEFEVRRRVSGLKVSATALRHLEVFENSRGQREGSLFAVINRTRTSSGARLLRNWLTAPLRDLNEIRARQNQISLWLESGPTLKEFRAQLPQLGDLERRLSKAYNLTFNARDLLNLAQSVLAGRDLTSLHPERPQLEGLDEAVALATRIEQTLADELPVGLKDGGLIRRGAVPELDELIDLTQNTQARLLELEARERAQTAVTSLKVRYNNVFGFYIEITKAQAHKAPTHYRRKQTLTNAERFTTDELDQLEVKILAARSRRAQLEFEIFSRLRQEVVENTVELLRLARTWTRWDTLSALAWLALERDYTCPALHDGSDLSSVGQGLHLELSRHPVIEQTLSTGFVPNTIDLKPGEGLLLTGPNMAGKSTIMRQVALTALLAQIGSFVPAKAATLPIFEEIFTRIGASDVLTEGLSTFMVEMSETSAILRRVNPRSLVVMDEIGRGTSTFDGLSLAQAILEHLVGQSKPYLLFATHYHELTALAQMYPQLHNAHMSIQEQGGEIQFLHTLKKGPANRSYGIHVAKLAGLPKTITARAQTLLRNFEAAPVRQQLSFGELLPKEPSKWLEEVKELNLSQMTPLEALTKLYSWQREASS